MTDKINIAELPTFDMAEHLDDEQAIADYLNIVTAEDDPGALAQALSTAARARGMSAVADASGLTREALYNPGAQPRFDTMRRVCAALGVRITATPAH